MGTKNRSKIASYVLYVSMFTLLTMVRGSRLNAARHPRGWHDLVHNVRLHFPTYHSTFLVGSAGSHGVQVSSSHGRSHATNIYVPTKHTHTHRYTGQNRAGLMH
jgi:hypothetical protein